MLAEHARVHRVHLLELVHVEEKDAATQHVLQVRPRRPENRADVPQALLGLRSGIAAGELSGRGIGGALPRHEYESLESHAWGVRADGTRKVLVVNRAVGHGRGGVLNQNWFDSVG